MYKGEEQTIETTQKAGQATTGIMTTIGVGVKARESASLVFRAWQDVSWCSLWRRVSPMKAPFLDMELLVLVS
jgi:hypothetical protein